MIFYLAPKSQLRLLRGAIITSFEKIYCDIKMVKEFAFEYVAQKL